MRNCIFALCSLMMSFCVCLAQTTSQPAYSPPNSPQSTPVNNNQRNTTDQKQQVLRENNSYNRLQMIEAQATYTEALSRGVNMELQSLYRKPGKDELKDLTPSQSLLSQYQVFLKQPNPGIVKLSADTNCVTNEKVIVVTENCLSKTIVGGGTAYSFRKKTHQMLHLADLILEKDIIKSDGLLQQGILVNLGNIELEKVKIGSNGIRFLSEYKPASNYEEIEKSISELNEGIKNGEYIYRFALFAEKDTTFAIRSIAFRGRILRSFKGFNYNELDFDKRKDILVAFRIIEKDENGDITLIWKELSQQNSPVMKLKEKEEK